MGILRAVEWSLGSRCRSITHCSRWSNWLNKGKTANYLETMEQFRRSILSKNCTNDAHMTQIDFIGIGAPKCGTTWLSAQLGAHPQIGFAPDKEVYYFADTILRRLAGQELRCFERGDAWYHEQFPARAGTIDRKS